jgi:hypothetical protein
MPARFRLEVRMSTSFRLVCVMLVGLAVASGPAPRAQQTTPGRALTIEDYYRIQATGSPSISPGPDGSSTVSTRIEDDNSTRTETWLVPADGSSKPSRVLHYGRDVTGARWTDAEKIEYAVDREQWSVDPATPGVPPIRVTTPRPGGGRGGRGGGAGSTDGQQAGGVASPDGRWLAAAPDKPQPRREPAPPPTSSASRRAVKGAIFD